jgi:uncharacterized protein YecE (DUF72 family)
VWSQLAKLSTPPIATTDFLYVRFIGDRSINEKDFGIIQKDRVSEMNNWASEIKNVEEGKERGRSGEEVSVAMIAANNHYAGFGPGTVNIFRTMVGQTELSWQDQEHIQRQIQQAKQLEKEQQFSLSNTLPRSQKRKRQSSLTEYIK